MNFDVEIIPDKITFLVENNTSHWFGIIMQGGLLRGAEWAEMTLFHKQPLEHVLMDPEHMEKEMLEGCMDYAKYMIDQDLEKFKDFNGFDFGGLEATHVSQCITGLHKCLDMEYASEKPLLKQEDLFYMLGRMFKDFERHKAMSELFQQAVEQLTKDK